MSKASSFREAFEACTRAVLNQNLLQRMCLLPMFEAKASRLIKTLSQKKQQQRNLLFETAPLELMKASLEVKC